MSIVSWHVLLVFFSVVGAVWVTFRLLVSVLYRRRVLLLDGVLRKAGWVYLGDSKRCDYYIHSTAKDKKEGTHVLEVDTVLGAGILNLVGIGLVLYENVPGNFWDGYKNYAIDMGTYIKFFEWTGYTKGSILTALFFVKLIATKYPNKVTS